MLILILNLFNFELFVLLFFFYLLFLISYLLTCLTAFSSAPSNHHSVCYVRNVLNKFITEGHWTWCPFWYLQLSFHVHWTFKLWTVKNWRGVKELLNGSFLWISFYYYCLFDIKIRINSFISEMRNKNWFNISSLENTASNTRKEKKTQEKKGSHSIMQRLLWFEHFYVDFYNCYCVVEHIYWFLWLFYECIY